MDTNIKSGIYIIRNEKNGKMYVGSAVNLMKRRREHERELLANKHNNHHLQNSFNKHGLESFTFNVVEYVSDITKLIPREQFYIDHYKAPFRDTGYNICVTAGSRLGMRHTDEAKRLIGAASIGRKASEETLKKFRDHGRNKGETHGMSKLTEEDVRDIKRRLMNGEKQPDIAKLYCVQPNTISRINTGARWPHTKI